MHALTFPASGQPLRVLALGAHADDIEIGAGATLLRLAAERPVVIHAAVFSATSQRQDEARASAAALFADAVSYELELHDMRESFFPDQWAAVKERVGTLTEFEPDVIFTHRQEDRHQDHRVLGELTWQAFRNSMILQYEIPKFEGDLGQPNAYVPIDEGLLARKIEILTSSFVSQADKQWFDADTFRGLARIRGIECGEPWAEAFHADKFTLSPNAVSPSEVTRGQ